MQPTMRQLHTYTAVAGEYRKLITTTRDAPYRPEKPNERRYITNGDGTEAITCMRWCDYSSNAAQKAGKANIYWGSEIEEISGKFCSQLHAYFEKTCLAPLALILGEAEGLHSKNLTIYTDNQAVYQSSNLKFQDVSRRSTAQSGATEEVQLALANVQAETARVLAENAELEQRLAIAIQALKSVQSVMVRIETDHIPVDAEVSAQEEKEQRLLQEIEMLKHIDTEEQIAHTDALERLSQKHEQKLITIRSDAQMIEDFKQVAAGLQPRENI